MFFGGFEPSAERQPSSPREVLPAQDGAGTLNLDVSLASFEVSRPEASVSGLAPLVSHAAAGASPARQAKAELAPIQRAKRPHGTETMACDTP